MKIQASPKTTLKIIQYVFALGSVVGLGLAGYSTFQVQEFLKNTAVTTGYVSQLVGTDSKAPFVTFQINRTTYSFKSSVSSNPPRYKLNQDVPVVYKVTDPNQARINTPFELWFEPGLLTVMSVVFGAIGFGLIIYARKRKKEIYHLKNFGNRIETTFVRVDVNRNTRVNNKHPYQVISQAIDPTTGNTLEYKSENLWEDPSEKIAEQTIMVMVDPKKPSSYYMELPFLEHYN